MKFGISFANVGPFVTGRGAGRLAKAAESAGFDSLWTVEHILYPEGYESTYPYAPDGKMPGSGNNPIPDPLVWLSYTAAVTSEIRLATGISLLPERHPLTFAKEVATLDLLSGGRVTLGVGIGWLKEEFVALGVPWARRAARTEEYIEVMQKVWAEDDVTFDGEFVSFSRASSNPKPVARSVPIHIGGHSEAAARRAGRLADGMFLAGGDIGHLINVARNTAADSGRDPEALEMSVVHMGMFGADVRAAVEETESWGAQRLMIPSLLFMRKTANALAEFGESVIAAHA